MSKPSPRARRRAPRLAGFGRHARSTTSTASRSAPTASSQHFNALADRRRRQGRPDARRRPIRDRAECERAIDGDGRTLLPGLIDAHGHVMDLGFAALQLDLDGHAVARRTCSNGCATMPRRIRDAKWIIGLRLEPGIVAGQALPDRRRSRRGRRRPAGRARAGRWPCGRRQQRGDEGRGRDRRDASAGRRTRSDERPVRRRGARA